MSAIWGTNIRSGGHLRRMLTLLCYTSHLFLLSHRDGYAAILFSVKNKGVIKKGLPRKDGYRFRLLTIKWSLASHLYIMASSLSNTSTLHEDSGLAVALTVWTHMCVSCRWTKHLPYGPGFVCIPQGPFQANVNWSGIWVQHIPAY